VSHETAGGDAWYDYDTEVVTSAAGTGLGAVYAIGDDGGWVTGGRAGHAYGPPSFLHATGSTTTTATTAPTTTTTTAPPTGGGSQLVTSFTPTWLRQDFSGWVGMQVRVGATPRTVSALGRWVVAGSTGGHALKLVDGGTGADVPGAAVTVETADAPAGAFRYATLPSPVTLRAGTTYYLVSAETAGGDRWYDYDTRVVTGPGADVTGAVYAMPDNPRTWVTGGGAGQGYGPLNLLFTS
jgi:hypothetical protein